MTSVAATPADERIARVGLFGRLAIKPGFGAVVGAIVIFVFFAAQSDVFRSMDGAANWLDYSSTYGLMAVPSIERKTSDCAAKNTKITTAPTTAPNPGLIASRPNRPTRATRSSVGVAATEVIGCLPGPA